jgi:hypothetical protein
MPQSFGQFFTNTVGFLAHGAMLLHGIFMGTDKLVCCFISLRSKSNKQAGQQNGGKLERLDECKILQDGLSFGGGARTVEYSKV